MSIVRVALKLPQPQLFDYLAEGVGAADVGRLVRVPFGKKRAIGLIVGLAEGSAVPAHKLRPVEAIVRELPPLASEWLALAEFCSRYYHRPLGEVIMTALPPRLRELKPLPEAAIGYRLTERGQQALARMPTRYRRQRALLERLASGAAESPELQRCARGSRRFLARALEAGWIAADSARSEPPALRALHALTEEQQRALAVLRPRLGEFGVSLLFGVTGSGKTEVYLQLVAAALAKGAQALVLVPEIALTPALQRVFRERFPGAHIAVQTSAMPPAERARSWLEAHLGRADVVLGTRLAVFASLPRLGLIVVDEEQDSSFKQQEGVRYSARDLAIARGRGAGVPVLLCSATPSLESYWRARSGKYALVELKRRAIEAARLPEVRIVDVRREVLAEGLSTALVEAIAGRLARGEQSLVFLNRRGYAPVLACPACGWVKGCRRCSAHMVLHLREARLRCHHCGLAEAVPRHCPSCGNVDLQPLGRGTQRIEAALERRFPGAAILRLDSDAARSRSTLNEILRRAESADILVGTQLLAKGHHFERLTLAAVLGADSGLFSGDYRASERSFTQLLQVAGRAGRANLAGEVLIQTRYPQHPLYRALVAHDYAAFADVLLEERRQAGFPPFLFEAVLRAESIALERALGFLSAARARAPAAGRGLRLYDPAPMALVRIAGRERAQMLVQASSRRRLHEFLAEWSDTLARLPARGVRWHLDVDPIEF